jgi:MFS transporter, OFA family, oxalate/formate antiporter
MPEGHNEKREPDRIVRATPFFYGWIILLVGTIGLIMTSPAQTYNVSIFIDHFIQDLNISRSLVSTLYSVGTLVGSFTLPFWGAQIDRFGPRRMATLISILFALACVYMGYVQSAFMLVLGFVAIRMLGQGSLSLVSQNVMNQWWVRRRGTVMGISGTVLALVGMGVFPLFTNMLIDGYGWRTAFMLLGALLFVVMTPISILFFRRSPETYNLHPDGKPLEDLPAAGQSQAAEVDWTLKEAMRTRVFWLLAASFALYTLLVTGQLFHMVGIVEDAGLDASVAATVFLPLSLMTAAATLTSGFLLDRVKIRWVLAVALLLQGVSLLMMSLLNSAGLALLYGGILGLSGGFFRTLGTVTWPKLFGRRYLGSIFGFASAAGVFGAALGPIPFGFARDFTGSYLPAAFTFLVLCVLLALLVFMTLKSDRVEKRGDS